MVAKYASQEVSYLIIGAGVAGLTAARTLKSAGFRVQVLDKGRGVGGRMATRRIAEGVFDHGAQYFSVRDPWFQKLVNRWQADEVVKIWADGFPTAHGELKKVGSRRYCGVHGMTAVPKALAAGLDIQLASRIEAITVHKDRWQAHADTGEVFEGSGLIMTAPVPQSLALLEQGQLTLPGQMMHELQQVQYHPCAALMVVLEKPGQVPAPGGVRMRKGSLRWIADNQQKGISPRATAVTIHASPEFSRRAWDMADEEILERLFAEAAPWIAGPVQTYQVHRWRYAQPIETYPVLQAPLPGIPPLQFAGDAFAGGRVEGAALSGLQSAKMIIQ